LTVACVYLYLIWKRRQTRRTLEKGGLPTVFWRPRFVNYLPADENQQSLREKLASSTITNILPRMQRLQGPYQMYGTVYGLSTAVVHIAHPVPAAAVLTAVTSRSSIESPDSSSKSSVSAAGPGQRSRSSKSNSSGATKAPAYNHFKNFCGEGVFTADGEDWREKRSAVMHALLRGSGGQGFEHKVERETHQAANMILQEIESQRETSPTGTKVQLNIVPLLQRATIGLIYRYITNGAIETSEGFSSGATQRVDVATVATEEDDTISTDESLSSIDSTPSLQEKSQPRPDLLSSYLLSITRIRMIILAQSRSIWFLLPRWWYHTFASMYREEEHTMGPIREFAQVACQNAQPGSPLAILRKNPIYQEDKDTKEAGVSKNLLDEAITLLFAGQDTSAATLSWTLHLLTLYPAIQDKLAREVQTVLGSSSTKNEPFVTKRVISSLPFLDAVIKESMRLYPVAPFVVRNLPFPVSMKNEETNKSPTVLPAGSIACIWIYSLHRNPRFWNRPNDFVPERWLDPELRDEGITCGAYIPFAVGPRNCVGQPLANIILRGLLARLIYRYEFRCDDLTSDTDPTSLRKDMQVGFTVLPKGGVKLAVHDRIPC
jgi:cytochrome P450